MGNAYGTKSLLEIQHDLQVLSTVAKPEDVYGLSAEQIQGLKGQATILGTVATTLANAVAAEKAARGARDEALANARDVLQATATVIYAQSPPTDAQLAAVGLAPRRSGAARPLPPVRVGGVVATPFADGTVKLAWNRMANPKSATFVVETSANGTDWAYLTSTSRIGLQSGGFAPGAPAWFRVTAKTAVAAAVPSSSVSVYAPEPAKVELRLAS